MVAWLAALTLAVATDAGAQTALPQPRLATSMHQGRIEQIRLGANGLLASIGVDKTLRIWRSADLVHLRTIPVPADTGEEGDLRALALAPDGRTAFVSGWTGTTWHRSTQVYRFEIATGRIDSVLRDQGPVVNSIAVSGDGKRLALGGAQSLRVIDATSGALLFEDHAYRERVTFVDFRADGAIATASADGCLRVYVDDYRVAFRAAYPPAAEGCGGANLGGVRFSPDGTKLAFGLKDRPEVVVMDARALSALRVIRVDDAAQRSLCCISWSPDSSRLLVYGEHDDGAASPLYVVPDSGLGTPRVAARTRHGATNSVQLADGGLIVATAGPGLLRLDAGGRTLAEVRTPGGDFRAAGRTLRVAADASTIELGYAADGNDVRSFSLDVLGAAPRRSAPPPLLEPMRSDHARVRIDAELGYFGYRRPVLANGRPVKLQPLQSAWSWAGHASLAVAAIGTGWSVLVVDDEGRTVWERWVSAAALGVNISADGRWVVAALADGTLVWMSVADGSTRLGYFEQADGSDWVAWRPDGYYASSPKGDELIGWLVNRGDDKAPDFVRAVQLEREMYQPEMVRAALAASMGLIPVERLAATLRRLAPPRVTIEDIRVAAEPGSMSIRFSVESTGRPVREVGVYVDGIPVLAAADRAVDSARSQRVERTVTARASSAAAVVRVEAESDGALGLDESASPLPLPLATAAPRPTGTLWVLAVGVEQFDRIPDLRRLPFATNDAHELAAAFAAQQGTAFAQVRTVVLTQAAADKPTKANILARLRDLEPMRADDTLVVFLASHGTTDGADYYFMTKDADPSDVRRLVDAQTSGKALPSAGAPSLLTGRELTSALRRLPGRRILILDTCQAGAAGSSDPYSLVKRSASAQLAVVSAARADESSYDSPTRQHGAFTIAIIDALTGKLTLPPGPITLRTVFDAATPEVQEVVRLLQARSADVARKAAIRQTPVLSATKVLERSVLADR